VIRARERGFSYRRDFIAAARAELARTGSVRASEATTDDDDALELAAPSADPYDGISWGDA
jgi:hypothetical protein